MVAILFIKFRTVVMHVISQTRISKCSIIIIRILLLRASDNCANYMKLKSPWNLLRKYDGVICIWPDTEQCIIYIYIYIYI